MAVYADMPPTKAQLLDESILMKPAASPPDRPYLDYIRDQVRAIRRRLPAEPPATEAGWTKRLQSVREGLIRSIGRTPDTPCDLAPEILGTLKRDGYAIERLTFQSRPGVRVTANLYRPENPKGPSAAVLCVHGHWAWARIDPNVQARCIGLARLGYVVLAVDAFGAGERAIDPKPGTYHGALTGASLWPTGVSLLGLQVYDNRRAVDYLVSRPEVDPKRLAITGASGGGNQSLYAGALDDRFAAVVPVCGIGTYESYLGTGCCVCEMNAGGLTYATTGDLLAMMAPRALLVVNATQDAVQFSVAEAAKSVAFARTRFQSLGVDARLRHTTVESGHGYNKEMREAMYGWLDRYLRGQGDGRPVTEPVIALEEPQTLRCYPDAASRPKSIVTIPEFAQSEGRARLAALPKPPDHLQRWEAEAAQLRAAMERLVAGPTAISGPAARNGGDVWTIQPEPGITVQGRRIGSAKPDAPVLLLRHEGQAPPDDPVVKALTASGRSVLTVDLRATGQGKPEGGVVHGVTDHNEAEWALWIGRPLLGQWVRDALAWIDAARCSEIVGVGPFGLVGLIAAGLRPSRVTRVGLVNPLVSFVADDTAPWSGVPMGLIVPNLLETADVSQLAALVAPNRLVIAGGVEPTGKPARMADAFRFTRKVYGLTKSIDLLTLLDSPNLADLSRILTAG
jgi:dienelactone hydrolase